MRQFSVPFHTYHNRGIVASALRLEEPFDDPHWLFELKHEGIRALAIVRHGQVRFLSQTGRWLGGFPQLAAAITRHLPVEEAILDGAIAAPERRGRDALSRLTRRPQAARFYAFDLVWLNGQDRRAVPLLSRKERLRELLPSRSDRLIFVGHVREYGTLLHRMACRYNLPGIIAKRADIAYDWTSMRSGWIEIRNPRYR
jgi:bifunctional non-homologous end joining protein LigD